MRRPDPGAGVAAGAGTASGASPSVAAVPFVAADPCPAVDGGVAAEGGATAGTSVTGARRSARFPRPDGATDEAVVRDRASPRPIPATTALSPSPAGRAVNGAAVLLESAGPQVTSDAPTTARAAAEARHRRAPRRVRAGTRRSSDPEPPREEGTCGE